MKLPKHRGNLYLVIRTMFNSATNCWTECTVGAFLTQEGADSYAGACSQTFLDRGYSPDDFVFDVRLTAYYDE